MDQRNYLQKILKNTVRFSSTKIAADFMDPIAILKLLQKNTTNKINKNARKYKIKDIY
jgi:hypothetical protein